MMNDRRGAICCISGGVDSVTTAYYVKKKLSPSKLMFIFCNYGQRTYRYEEFCTAGRQPRASYSVYFSMFACYPFHICSGIPSFLDGFYGI